MGIVMKDIGKSFGEPPTRVLEDLSLEVSDGEFVAVTGRSGSGKSTALYIMSTLDLPTSGTVSIDGLDVAGLSVEELHLFRNERMGFVFQFHYLLPELTALENVLMPAMKSGRSERKEPAALELLREFGLADKRDRRPGELSGGEQQRVAIARALVMEPKYLFADEPTGNLDSANGLAVMSFFQRINRERGTTILYVTHDPDFAAMAGRRIHLVDGRISLTES
jgi:putative ABC transport system ATP-binding protein/lipoprotein-releasing system ATP-binding protein